MNATVPPGYKGLVALDKQKHKGLGVATARQYGFAAAMTGVYVVAQEFVQAARHYPLVFARDEKTGAILPVAVTGLNQSENLFVNQLGEWESGVYIPAYVRRWPFFGMRIKEGNKDGNIVICVDEAGLEPSSTPIFDEQGELAESFNACKTLIQEMEGSRQITENLCNTANELGLLEPFEAHAFPKAGREMRLRGMLRVNESKLNDLQTKDIKRLMRHGLLSRIYAHLMSLDNFKFLMERATKLESPARMAS